MGQREAEATLGGRGRTVAEQIVRGRSSFRSSVGREEGVTTGLACPQGSAPTLLRDTLHMDTLLLVAGGDQPTRGGWSRVRGDGQTLPAAWGTRRPETQRDEVSVRAGAEPQPPPHAQETPQAPPTQSPDGSHLLAHVEEEPQCQEDEPQHEAPHPREHLAPGGVRLHLCGDESRASGLGGPRPTPQRDQGLGPHPTRLPDRAGPYPTAG